MQGHVAQTDIDPGAAPEWLRIADDQLLPSPNAGITLRSAQRGCLPLLLPSILEAHTTVLVCQYNVGMRFY